MASPSALRPSKVFISYSHDSPEHMDRVLALCDRLRSEGIDAWIDQYETAPPEGWARWAAGRLEEADHVLVVCSETYVRRFQGKEEPGRGLGARWEGHIIESEIYGAGVRHEKFIPVLFPPVQAEDIPSALRGSTWYDLRTEAGYLRMYRRLTGQPETPPPDLGTILPLPPRDRLTRFLGDSQEPAYENEWTRGLALELEAAQERYEERVSAGKDAEGLLQEILALRQKMREGGQLHPGDLLAGGRFKLLEEIGQGGFATVWKAWDRKGLVIVAVKVLHGSYSRDRSRVLRFFRGARKMAELHHQGVVRVIESYHHVEDGGFQFFVMEHVAGGDLRQAVLSGRLLPGSVLPVILEVGETLSFAHRRRVIHRDVKPANILMDGEQPKLTDFDLVRAFDTTGGTRTGSMLGTFLYTAPEILADAKGAGVQADVYSLAMTAIFALYGRELPMTVFRDPEVVLGVLPCPPEVREVLARAISWEPRERPSSMEELCRELKNADRSWPVFWDPPRGGARPAEQADEDGNGGRERSELRQEKASSLLDKLRLAWGSSVATREREKRRDERRLLAQRLQAKSAELRKAGPAVPLPSQLPPMLLDQEAQAAMPEPGELVRLSEKIRFSLSESGVGGTIEAIQPGPLVSVFELQPAPGARLDRILPLQERLTLTLGTGPVRIVRLIGRSALGIEVPNRERGEIRLGPLLADARFRRYPSLLALALGCDPRGEPHYADLAAMPHLLIAGSSGSGTGSLLRSLITSILYKAAPAEVQLILMDLAGEGIGVYSGIPNLKCDVIADARTGANALHWAVIEMERRYRLLAEVRSRSLAHYNRLLGELKPGEGGVGLRPIPLCVVIIDELAALTGAIREAAQTSILYLAQMARAVGIHLIVTTQTPSEQVLTGTIKANLLWRISCATTSPDESRLILDQAGAEKLLGGGDMLLLPPGASRVVRLHGASISDRDTEALVRWLRAQGSPGLNPEVLRTPAIRDEDSEDGGDELYDEAARLVVTMGHVSANFLQRRLRIGYSRAARLIDRMERDGLVGPSQGSRPREVLVPPDFFG